MRPLLLLLSFFCLGLSSTWAESTSLHCPADQQLTCTAPTHDLSIYGDAFILVHGVKKSAGLSQVHRNTNSCNVGTITRTWQVKDDNGEILECSQRLRFLPGNFNESNINWPRRDTVLVGCDNVAIPDSLPEEFQEPTFDYVQCSHVGSTFNDQNFDFGPDCRKIVREWTVIDWCRYQPGGSAGSFRYSQVFKISNSEEPPAISCPKDITINPTRCDSARVNLPLATTSGTPCTGSYVITNMSPFADTTTNNASGVYPLGETLILYKMEYACGDELTCRTRLHVNRIINPVPYCLATLNVVLMPLDTDGDGAVDDGMVDVWAKDLNVDSYHPCYETPLTFSFDSTAVEMSKTFTCEEVGHNNINIYVTDKNNRQSYCRVDINVQNNAAQIPDCEAAILNNLTVYGAVTDPYGQALEQVIVSHRDTEQMNVIESDGESNSYQISISAVTDALGIYKVEDLSLGRGYLIQAYKLGQTQLVTQADVDLLEAFIQGEQNFSSPYTYLSADIDEDGVVDIADFHMLKNLLGLSEDAWPNEKQWLFFRKASMGQMNATAPSLNELQQSIEMIELNQGDEPDLDFIGILKGDLTQYEGL